MAETNDSLPTLYPVAGLRLGTACAGFKQAEHRDLVVMALAEGSRVAAVFTRNAFRAAPVLVAEQHLRQTSPRFLVVNTGNANAGTGEAGLRAARETCALLAAETGCAVEAVLPFSTGVIGEPLPMAPMRRGLPQAVAALDEAGWRDAAWGILTTDTVPKGVSRRLEIDGRAVTITGISKGSGMIRPDMATMLAYLATDARVPQPVLAACLSRAVEHSFNRITVDGDTSTNDACVLIATGQGEVTVEGTEDPAFEALCTAVSEVCESLARAIVRDGEGATKLIDIQVEGGRDQAECLQVAYAIAHSPLVKTAFFASDPNWGRILAVVGRAGLQGLDIAAVELWLDEVCIVRDGGRAADYSEAAGQAVMSRNAITVRVVLGRGVACERVWTCDLSYDYVRINAEYRT